MFSWEVGREQSNFVIIGRGGFPGSTRELTKVYTSAYYTMLRAIDPPMHRAVGSSKQIAYYTLRNRDGQCSLPYIYGFSNIINSQNKLIKL